MKFQLNIKSIAVSLGTPKPEKLKISEAYMPPERAVYTQVGHNGCAGCYSQHRLFQIPVPANVLQTVVSVYFKWHVCVPS
jgi:hypothetical protein